MSSGMGSFGPIWNAPLTRAKLLAVLCVLERMVSSDVGREGERMARGVVGEEASSSLLGVDSIATSSSSIMLSGAGSAAS
jgi:hypothetical protein